MTAPEPCPFCGADDALFETTLWRARRDRYPVNEGHLLLVPKRHLSSALELTAEEWQDLRGAITRACDLLQSERRVDGFNIGVNVGAAAGQTIWHVHVHVIPRYEGDCESPRGGVRKVKRAVVEY